LAWVHLQDLTRRDCGGGGGGELLNVFDVGHLDNLRLPALLSACFLSCLAVFDYLCAKGSLAKLAFLQLLALRAQAGLKLGAQLRHCLEHL
jgi:hypothetical protein